MESSNPPPPAAQPPRMAGLTLDVLRRAVDVYLGVAYPTTPPSEAVRRRLAWPADVELADLLRKPPFERVTQGQGQDPDQAPCAGPIYALRLGNARYPHMKMQVQPWDGPDGYLLSVNTHDHALSVDPNAPDAAAFAALQAENQALKVAIERAWDQAGLPTFPRYLRNYLIAQRGAVPANPAGGLA